MASSFNDFYRKWALINSLIVLLSFTLALVRSNEVFWWGIVLTFGYYIIQLRRFISFPLAIGYANWITILRLTILVITAFFYNHLQDSTLFIIFFVIILMDGLDGFLARKTGHSSKPGEYLDMETDALMVLVLCWIHFQTGKLFWGILIPGGLRYLYVVMFFWTRGNLIDFPPKMIRTTIAVIFFLALLMPFVWISDISKIVLLGASILIIISFSLSITANIKNLLKDG